MGVWEDRCSCAMDAVDTPEWSAGLARPGTQRVPFKTGVRSFSWQGIDWCGGQPGGDRGGALAAQDKWSLCATFG